MGMQTELTRLLGITYPVFQGGMAWVAEANLAAAVSNGGGLGIIAAANQDAAAVRAQIQAAKQKTEKPFGVNVMLLSPHVEEVAAVIAEERVPVVTTGAGDPGKYIGLWKQAGCKVFPVVPSCAFARRMQRLGADGVIAEGCESGGHSGELTTMALIPQVVDSVDLPVLAAGGIADGRGLAAALMLGACGVQMGTRFLAAEECVIHQAYKQKVIAAKDTDTIVTGRSTGHPVRALKNRLARQYQELEASGASPEELEALGLGALKKAVVEGDVTYGTVMAGQIAGLVKEELPAAQILREVCEKAQALLEGGASLG